MQNATDFVIGRMREGGVQFLVINVFEINMIHLCLVASGPFYDCYKYISYMMHL